MEVTLLRSSLQHACSELRNLTDAELLEAKWLTKKKVFQQLLAAAPCLHEHNEDLIDLNEQRCEESADQKRNGASKEERIESESAFRTKFMRIVLAGLTALKWPPSQEAFSDPLDALFNEAGVFHDAALFILQVGVPGALDRRREKLPSSPPPATKTPPKQSQTHNAKAFDTSISMISYAPSDVHDHEDRDSVFAGTGMEIGSSRQPLPAPVQESPRYPAIVEQPSVITSARERKAELNWRAFEILQRQNEQLSCRLRALQQSVLKRDETEAKVAGILTELRSMVGEIVEASGTRSGGGGGGVGQDRDSGSIVRGLDAALAAVAVASGEDGGTAVGSGPGGKGASKLSKEAEMAAFRLEAEREQAELAAKKDKTLGATTVAAAGASKSAQGKKASAGVAMADPGAALCGNCSAKLSHTKAATPSFSADKASSSSAVLWSRVHSRIAAMEDQWNAAQRSARRQAEGHGAGGGSSPSLRTRRSPGGMSAGGGGGGGGGGGREGVLFTSTRTPSRSVVNQTLGVQPPLWRGGGEVGSGGQENGLFASPPQPPGSRAPYEGIGGAGGDGADVGLDLARLHLIQRDLVAFAERAFALTSASTTSTGATVDEERDGQSTARSRSGRNTAGERGARSALPVAGLGAIMQPPQVFPGTAETAQRQQDCLALQESAWDLVLHLSSLAAVAPLSTRSPLRSCVTGLQALLQELNESAYPKVSKSTQLRLQAAADRALAEQVAVIRCLSQARNCLRQWASHAAAVGPGLRTLGKQVRKTVEHAASELDERGAAMRAVLQALDAAEAARIPPPRQLSGHGSGGDDGGSVDTSRGSARAGALVCPLDALARGVAGKEISALVNALRLHRDDVQTMSASVRTLGSKMTAELRGELEMLANSEGNISCAAQLTEAVLQRPLPGQQDGATRKGNGSGYGAATGTEEGEESPTAPTKRNGKGSQQSAAAGGSGVHRTEGSSRRSQAGGGATKSDLSTRPPFDLSLS